MASKKPRTEAIASRYVACPVCERSIPTTFIGFHLDKCVDKESPKPGGAAAFVSGTKEECHHNPEHTQTQYQEQLSEELNAFSKMKEAAAISQPIKEFLLMYRDETSGQLRVKAISQRPEEIKELWETKINMRKTDSLSQPISLWLGTCLQPAVKPYSRTRYNQLPISVLKSGLQKSVRLGRVKQATAIAAELASASFTDLIRRIPIIALEDSILHPRFALISWLTVAISKGYIPTEEQVGICIGVARDLAAINLKEGLDPALADSPPSIEFRNITLLDNDERCMIRSLQIRRSFGGMQGDLTMMGFYTSLWMERFMKSDETIKAACARWNIQSTSVKWMEWLEAQFKTLNEQIDIRQIPAVEIEDIPPSAVDFHCSPSMPIDILQGASGSVIVAEIKKVDPTAEAEEVLNKVIWHFRSCINHKTELGVSHPDAPQNLVNVWETAKESIESYSCEKIKRWFKPTLT